MEKKEEETGVTEWQKGIEADVAKLMEETKKLKDKAKRLKRENKILAAELELERGGGGGSAYSIEYERGLLKADLKEHNKTWETTEDEEEEIWAEHGRKRIEDKIERCNLQLEILEHRQKTRKQSSKRINHVDFYLGAEVYWNGYKYVAGWR